MKTRIPAYAKPVGIVVALLFLGVALVPFLFSEWWGMVWFYLTAPISFFMEELIGVGSESTLLIAAISVLCAALWGWVTFVLCVVFHSVRGRVLLAIFMAALSACSGAGDSSLRSRFVRERAALACLEGPTSEPSCGGATLTVFLNGDRVCRLDWAIETSHKLIRRQYYFDANSPRLVVETIHAKLDAHGELLTNPLLLSTLEYRLDMSPPNARQAELLKHARFLMEDFKKHRTAFADTNVRQR